VLQECETRKR